MYEDIFASIRQAAEKRNLRERTIQLYDISCAAQISRPPSSLLRMQMHSLP